MEIITHRFGWFSAPALFVPLLRRLVIRRFRVELIRIWESGPPDQRIDIAAHSFGTFVAAHALRSLPRESPVKVHTLLFAGSILPSTFRWTKLISRRVTRVINDCGTKDWIVVLAQLGILGAGAAGFVGFVGSSSNLGAGVHDRFFGFSHSGFSRVHKGHDFLEQYWKPAILHDGPVPQVDERPDKLWVGWLSLAIRNGSALKLLFYLASVWAAFWLLAYPTRIAREARWAVALTENARTAYLNGRSIDSLKSSLEALRHQPETDARRWLITAALGTLSPGWIGRDVPGFGIAANGRTLFGIQDQELVLTEIATGLSRRHRFSCHGLLSRPPGEDTRVWMSADEAVIALRSGSSGSLELCTSDSSWYLDSTGALSEEPSDTPCSHGTVQFATETSRALVTCDGIIGIVDLTSEVPALRIHSLDGGIPSRTALSSDGRVVAFTRNDRVEAIRVGDGELALTIIADTDNVVGLLFQSSGGEEENLLIIRGSERAGDRGTGSVLVVSAGEIGSARVISPDPPWALPGSPDCTGPAIEASGGREAYAPIYLLISSDGTEIPVMVDPNDSEATLGRYGVKQANPEVSLCVMDQGSYEPMRRIAAGHFDRRSLQITDDGSLVLLEGAVSTLLISGVTGTIVSEVTIPGEHLLDRSGSFLVSATHACETGLCDDPTMPHFTAVTPILAHSRSSAWEGDRPLPPAGGQAAGRSETVTGSWRIESSETRPARPPVPGNPLDQPRLLTDLELVHPNRGRRRATVPGALVDHVSLTRRNALALLTLGGISDSRFDDESLVVLLDPECPDSFSRTDVRLFLRLGLAGGFFVDSEQTMATVFGIQSGAGAGANSALVTVSLPESECRRGDVPPLEILREARLLSNPEAEAIVISPSGSLVLARVDGGYRGRPWLALIHPADDQADVLEWGNSGILTGDFLLNDNLLAALLDDGILRVWDVKSKTLIWRRNLVAGAELISLRRRLSCDSNHLRTGLGSVSDRSERSCMSEGGRTGRWEIALKEDRSALTVEAGDYIYHVPLTVKPATWSDTLLEARRITDSSQTEMFR
jgi:hypothetical protein